jgi:site-specific recombinase XerC
MDDAQAERVATFVDGYLRTERNFSPHTAAAYRRDLDELVRWCAAQGVDDWKALDTHAVRAFAAAQHRRGLSPTSLQRRLSAVRSFCKWLVHEGVLGHNPASDVRALFARIPEPERGERPSAEAAAPAALVGVASGSPSQCRHSLTVGTT